MNCDLILTENSCRLCLGDAKEGNVIFSDMKTYFYVEKRLIEFDDISKFVNINIRNNNQLPDVPNRICLDCKKTIVAFYSLKKNFQDNEAVLLGKFEDVDGSGELTEKVEEDPVKTELLPVIKEYLKEHVNDCLQVTKYSDKLVLGPQKNLK